MSTAAVMLVKDEADVIEPVLHHLAEQVDEIYVSDNGSSDGTREILAGIDLPVPMSAGDDPEVGYFQSRKTTELAMLALADGHSWVVPCDADEVWYATDGRRIADFLSSFADAKIIEAELYDHFPGPLDPPTHDPAPLDQAAALGAPDDVIADGIAREQDEEANPFLRIGHRKRERTRLPKVACRLHPSLEIGMGNHSATIAGSELRSGGLCVRHFSWRSEEQYLRKITNGVRAYAATDFPESVGLHWRMFGEPESPDFEERVLAHFREWFWLDPERDLSLIYDPVTPFLRG